MAVMLCGVPENARVLGCTCGGSPRNPRSLSCSAGGAENARVLGYTLRFPSQAPRIKTTNY